MSTFAILYEPATYTRDRNNLVYDSFGIKYEFIRGSSEASEKGLNDEASRSLADYPIWMLIRHLWSILRNNDTVIINGYNHRYFILLFCLNVFWKRRIGIDSDTQLVIPSNPVKRWVKSLYLGTIFRNRNVYGLAGGTQSHKALFRHYGMDEYRVFLMPMMVNNDRFYHVKDECSNSSFVFLYVGRIVNCKNIETLLDAFVKEFFNQDNVQLRIVGDGEMLPDLKSKYRASDKIVFLGKKYGADLAEQYHQASVFVLPSSYEPWGLVVNEAMCASLPVIVSDQVGASFDLVEGHDTGFVFRYDNVEELGKRMRMLYEDPVLWKRCSENAYKRMHDYWNFNLYSSCLSSFLSCDQ